MGLSFSILSIGPRIAKEDGKLVARTSFRVALLSLGLSWRNVVVDPKRRKIIISKRLFWFFKRKRVIPFRFIESVRYGYDDLSGNSDWPAAAQTFDYFKVGLKLYNGEIIPLFNFLGRGSFVNNSVMPDWWYWSKSCTSASGTQEQESKLYVELLQHLIGKPLSA